MRRNFSLYILECADGSLYTGIACDVASRIAQHQSGRNGAKYLRGKAPFRLVFQQAVGDRSVAQRAEYRVKRLRPLQKRALIDGARNLDELLAD